MTDDAITFGQRRQIGHSDIRVGWIEKHDDTRPTSWRLRFTLGLGPIKGLSRRKPL